MDCQNKCGIELKSEEVANGIKIYCQKCGWFKIEEKVSEKDTMIDIKKMFLKAIKKKPKMEVEELQVRKSQILFSDPEEDKYILKFKVFEKYEFGDLIKAARNLKIEGEESFSLYGCIEKDVSPFGDKSEVEYQFHYVVDISDEYKNKLLEEVTNG